MQDARDTWRDGAPEPFKAFATHLAYTLPSLEVKINIARSRYCDAIQTTVVGFERLTSLYQWKSSWTDADGNCRRSGDWASTKISMNILRSQLRSEVYRDGENEKNVLNATLCVLKWGGDRNEKNGATPFLAGLAQKNALRQYLKDCEKYLSMEGDRSPLPPVIEMNSMLSKVHSLMATDGLPIYDTRVAAAIATLASQFWIKSTESIPDCIKFPIIGMNRRVPQAAVLQYPPGAHDEVKRQRRRAHAQTWAGAMWRLGKLIRLTLDINPKLFADEGDTAARCHAFEAALFMIGYDHQCITSHSDIK